MTPISFLLQMAKNKLIRSPDDTEVVSTFARQYQVIKAKKKQQQPTSRQSSTEETDKTKVRTKVVRTKVYLVRAEFFYDTDKKLRIGLNFQVILMEFPISLFHSNRQNLLL